MNLKISGHHLEITPPMREYVQNKLERIKRHFDNVIDISVTLAVDSLTEKEKRQRAEINLHTRGKDFHVESEAQDMYAAIDLLMDKLDLGRRIRWEQENLILTFLTIKDLFQDFFVIYLRI